MPTRFVLTFAFENSNGGMLLVKRAGNLPEYPGAWSLPSKSVDDQTFVSAIDNPEMALATLKGVLRSSHITSVKCVGEARRSREHYDINMALFHVKTERPVSLLSKKYIDSQWHQPHELTQLFPNGGGLCIAMLITFLIERRRIDFATKFFDIPPELYGKNPNEWDNSRIWRETAYDQYIQMRGKSGLIGGFFLKENTVDRYLMRRAKELLGNGSGRALDIGCGDGQLVADLRTAGIEAFGCDIGIGETNTVEWLRQIDLEQGSKPWPEEFEVVIINLVLSWVQNLDNALRAALESCDRDGTIIVIVPAPEYSKNGFFREHNGSFHWVIDEPTRRAPFPTMINLNVGPLIYHPRTFPDYINAFSRLGLTLTASEYIFLDTELSPDELETALAQWPDLRRNVKFPSFATFDLKRTKESSEVTNHVLDPKRDAASDRRSPHNGVSSAHKKRGGQ